MILQYLRANKLLLYAIALSISSLLILALRVGFTRQAEFLFLATNLFLAWIPFGISFILNKSTPQTHPLFKGILFVLWFLFFPNSAYILTDLFHLDKYDTMPQWFDLLMLLTFSWAGIIWGFLSVQNIHIKFFKKSTNQVSVVFIITLFFLSGIGIYLGRYERWNSWDIFFDLRTILSDTIALFSNTQSIIYMFSMGILYCVLLSFMFFPFMNNLHFSIHNKNKIQ